MTAYPLRHLLLALCACMFLLQSKANPPKNPVSLRDALKQVTEVYGTQFVYDPTVVNGKTTTYDFKANAKKPVEDVLKAILYPNELVFLYISSNYYSIVSKDRLTEVTQSSNSVNAEMTNTSTNTAKQTTISGTVKDNKGASLASVTVNEKGTNNSTITREDGSFTINVAGSQSVLVFSSIGFETKEVTVGNQSTVNVILQPTDANLGEVVVVGYGTQRKEDLTGAISTVNYDKVLENRPITNPSQALGGKTTGVWVSQNSGKPGSDGAQLRIRGWGTLNNAAPLVLIDGAEGSINEVNPNDIESISVLKDAASAAIYGSRAANGVVLITTKSGKYNQKTQVSLSSYLGAQSLGRKYDIIDNSVEYMNLWNQALVNQGGSKLFPDSVINNFQNNSDPYKYPNTNFFDEVFKTAPVTGHNLSVRGGSEKAKYFMSFNYLDQDGMMLNTNSKRYGLTLNLESKISKWLNIGGRINGMRKISQEPYDIGRVLYIFSNGAYPFTAPYTDDGRFGAVEAISNGNMIVGNRNPLIETANGLTRYENNYYKMNAFADITFTDYLKFKTNFTSQQNHNLRDKYNQRIYGYTTTGIEAKNLDYPTTLETNRNDNDTYYYAWYNTLNFDKRFGENHHVTAIAGMQVENTVLKNNYARRTDPPKDGLTQVDAGTTGIQANGNMNTFRMLSYFGRLNYSFANKYLFEVNFRADASSRFARGHRWGTFPGISAAWRLSEEGFMKGSNTFSDLKVRASYGQLGNENIVGYWPYLTVINQNNGLSYNYAGALAPGAAVTALANQAITWETASTTDIGVDFGFLNNRLSGSIDVFHKVTSDIIVQLPIPLLLGALTAPYENVGEMLNKGLELNLNYAVPAADRNGFSYSIGGNLTYIHNQVTKFRGGKSPDQLYLIREGYSYRELYGFKAIGIFQTDKEAKDYMHSNGYIPKAGDLKFEDVNKDGKIGFEDKMALGNTIPKFTYGATLSFSYKGFDLNILMQGIAGVNAYTANAWTRPLGISGGTITKRWENAWTEQNTNTNIPAIKINDSWNNQESSFWVSDISFIKAKNIQLGYTFSEQITSVLHVQSLYAYVNAQNAFSFVNKNYEGFDPERNTFDSGENFYPIPRIFSFGINVNF